MPIRALALALLTLFALLAPALGQEADGPSGTIAAESDAGLDASIATRIREILAELGGYGDVTVTVNEGVVTLRGETASVAEAEALTGIVNRIEGVVQVRNVVSQTADLSRQLDPAWERFQTRLWQVAAALPLLGVAAAVFAAIVALGFLLARIRAPFKRLAPNAFIADLIRQVVRLVFVVVGIVVALDILNATALLSTILGAAGLIGLAIGFAVRDTVENFIASVLLSIRQPFGPNDVVEINGDTGKVIRLTSRATILLSFDGNHIRIPNATVFKSRIINYSQHPETRFKFTIAVALDCDLGHAKDLARQTVQSLPFVTTSPPADAWFGDINDSGLDLVVTGWVRQAETSLQAARGEALRQVLRAFEAEGIEVPDKSYRVVMSGPAGRPERDPPPGRHATEDMSVAAVPAAAERALDAIVDAERDDAETEDLLREKPAKE